MINVELVGGAKDGETMRIDDSAGVPPLIRVPLPVSISFFTITEPETVPELPGFGLGEFVFTNVGEDGTYYYRLKQ